MVCEGSESGVPPARWGREDHTGEAVLVRPCEAWARGLQSRRASRSTCDCVCGDGRREELPLDLPEDVRGTPVTYLSSSDMLNIVKELHSFPDIMDYLDARLTLPQGLRRTIG